MAWNQTYWDIQDLLYWAPQYVGMKSIPLRLWQITDDQVSIPASKVNPDGPLYRRAKKASALRASYSNP